MTMTAAALTETLRGHYLPPSRPAGGLFAAEVGSPCGRRRADALWLPLTKAGGTGLIGHEIKVSRADVIVELADPTKAEPWSQFCREWWLVVSDPALIDGLDIPEAWGVMSPPSGRRTRSMTIIRKAPKLSPLEPAVALRRLLGWYFYKTQEQTFEFERDKGYLERENARLQRDLAEARAGGGSHLSPHGRRVAGIIHEAEKRLNDAHVWAKVDDESVIGAIVDAEATRHAARRVLNEIDYRVSNIDAALEPLRHARKSVDEAIALARKGLPA